MSREYCLGPVTRAEKAEARVEQLEERLATAADLLDRFVASLSPRDQRRIKAELDRLEAKR